MGYGLIAAVMWGLSAVAAAKAARRTGTYLAVLCGQGIGVLSLLVLATAVRTSFAAVDGTIALHLAGAGLVGLLGYLCYYRAIEDGPVGLGSAISSTYGGIAALLAVIVLGERLGAIGIAGVVLAVPPGPAGTPGAARPVRPLSPPRPALVVAGCDPAIPLLEAPLGLLDPPVSFAWWQCASGAALELAARGLVHAAGAHLRGRSGEYNVGSARTVLRQGAEVIGFCAWREGLVLRPGHAVSGITDVIKAGLRLANREPGSEARLLLDRELAAAGADPAQLPGYDSQATGHLHVASAVAAGLADVGVASEPAALAYGLAFIPLAAERFDLVIPAGQAGSREVAGLLKVLSSRWLLDQLASLPGYDPARCGEHIATLPPA